MNLCRYLPVLLLLAVVPARAQDNGGSDLYLGIAPGMAMRWQQGTMRTTDGYYDCCSFTGGSGIGVAGELRALYRLGGAFQLRFGAGWEQVVSDYASEGKNLPILGQGNTVEYVDLKNDLGVTLPAAQFNAGLQYLVIEPGLYLTAGIGVTVPLSPSWTQSEEITGPPGVRYLDGSLRKTLFDADIPGTRPFPSLRLGGGAMIPIAPSLHLAPEMLFSMPLMELQPDYRWAMSGLDVSVAVMVGL